MSQHALNLQPFAGRIGANQQFTVSHDDPNYNKITATAPDAARNLTWRASLDPSGFSDTKLYKQAAIEAFGTCLQVYLSGLLGLGLAPLAAQTRLGALLPVAVGALGNLVLVPLFVFAGGPLSGGHFNPLITIATFTTRLATGPRAVLYVVGQCLGAVVGGFVIRGCLGLPAEELRMVPGCYIDVSVVSAGQAWGLETMSAIALVFLSFGVGLDPRQASVFGPALSPILVGLTSAICTLATGFVHPGYTGSSLNPARCLGLMAASESFNYHYVHWTGDISAAIINGFMYQLLAP